MAARDAVDQFKAHVERLRRDSLDVVANASRVVFEGVQKLAEQELKALNDYYKSAVGAARRASGPGELATQQLDLLQDTVQKVIAAARDSLSIVADTRAELARLVGRDASALDGKVLARATAPAQKALEDVRKVAAEAQRTAARTATQARKALEKELDAAGKTGRTAVRQTAVRAHEVGKRVKNRIGSVLDIAPPPVVAKKAVTTKPSPESRAARAANKARKPVAAKMPPAGSTMPPRRKKAGG